MMNRDVVKWQPFSAVVPGNIMIKHVLNKKAKIEKPILSEDQLNKLQEEVLNHYNNQDIIKIDYYKAGEIYKIEGLITNIDYENHKLVIDKKISLFFSQIIALF